MTEEVRNAAEVVAAARAAVRDVPDFPKDGILFKDITPLLADPALFLDVCALLTAPFVRDGITQVVAVESRGFILGAPVAHALGAGFVPVRKPGKLPSRTIREEYALEYGADALEIHADALTAGSRVLVVDDVLATGGTAAATCRLVERTGASVVGCAFLIELGFLAGRGKLAGRRIESLLTY
jgi:adenine phosphoribosyltransferase